MIKIFFGFCFWAPTSSVEHFFGFYTIPEKLFGYHKESEKNREKALSCAMGNPPNTDLLCSKYEEERKSYGISWLSSAIPRERYSRELVEKEAQSLEILLNHIGDNHLYKHTDDLSHALARAFEHDHEGYLRVLLLKGVVLNKGDREWISRIFDEDREDSSRFHSKEVFEAWEMYKKAHASVFHVPTLHRVIRRVKKIFKKQQPLPSSSYPTSAHAKMLHQHARTLARIGADLQKLLK